MAPYPEEVDVFSIPHSRMKNLVYNYCDMLSKTNFSSGREFEYLLNSLRNTFNEFRTHELIENKYIMKKLKKKLKELSIQNAAVCNCHKDNQLEEIGALFRDAAEWRRRSRIERALHGAKLRKTLDEFTEHFLPHMKEEEEVFQPLLMKHFSYEELRMIKSKVISEHENWNKKYIWEEKRFYESDETEEEEDPCLEVSKPLPTEVLLEVFSYLSPVELCRAAQVNRTWNQASMDPSLWRDIRPVRWARGDWTRGEGSESCEEEAQYDHEECPDVYIKDEDADLDESGDSDTPGQSADSVSRVKREWLVIQSLCKYVLPRVGHGVRHVDLACSRGLTNGSLYRILKLCPSVETINLAHTKITDFGFRGLEKSSGGANLRRIDLSGCSSITDKTLGRLFSCLLSDEGSQSNKDNYCRLGQCCRRMAPDDDSDTVRTLNGVSKLERLNLSGCYRITDWGLRYLGAGGPLPRLTRLDLSGLPSLSSPALTRLVRRCPALDHRFFSYCDLIQDGPMAGLANGCQNLACPSRACCRRLLEQ